jgi:hypothetical protein
MIKKTGKNWAVVRDGVTIAIKPTKASAEAFELSFVPRRSVEERRIARLKRKAEAIPQRKPAEAKPPRKPWAKPSLVALKPAANTKPKPPRRPLEERRRARLLLLSNSKRKPKTAAERAAYALDNPDPDGPGMEVRAAHRDLSCAMSGDEFYRKVIYPGFNTAVWPDTDERMPPVGPSAHNRRATTYCRIPSGTIVLEWSRTYYKGKRGKSSFRAGVIIPKTADSKEASVLWLEHRTLRSRPVWEVSLPNGKTFDVSRNRE